MLNVPPVQGQGFEHWYPSIIVTYCCSSLHERGKLNMGKMIKSKWEVYCPCDTSAVAAAAAVVGVTKCLRILIQTQACNCFSTLSWIHIMVCPRTSIDDSTIQLRLLRTHLQQDCIYI